MRVRVFIFLGLLVLSPIAFLQAADIPLKKISFIPLWKPQAQFAGYFVAKEKGFYARRGLEVNILEGGADHPPEKLLADGSADFGILWLSSALQRRASGMKLVNIGQFIQSSGLMLISRKSSAITSPQDMRGKKVSLWEGDLRVQPQAFLRKYGLDVTIVPQSYTVNLFLSGGVDVVSGMWYNEYDTIVNSGIDPEELSVFFFSGHGLDFPEDGIYCLEKTLADDPQAAGYFVSASLEGWEYAFAHPDEALEIVLKYMKAAHIPANRVHQKWMLERVKDLMISRETGRMTAVLDKKDYEQVALELLSSGLISEAPGYADFYPPAGQQ
jgi:NitT/TauT family transport system substrate-binding protein